jgi:hypothetical protein
MTIHLGDVPASSTLYIPFASYDANGASVTLSGLAVTDIEIYKNGSTTQRASDNGYTLLDTDGIDFDGITGLHGFSVDLSDNSDSGFYSVGGFYWVVVSTVTISTQTVTFIAATFRIVAAEAVTGKPKVDVDAFGGTAGTFSSGRPEVNTTHIAGSAVSTSTAQIGVNVIQAAGTAWNSGAIGAATLASDTITAAKIAADAITDAKVASDVTIASVTGAVGSVTGNVSGNVVGSVASVTGNVGGNVTGSVGSVAAAGIAAASFASGAITADAIATDAIGAAELAASAVTEIQSGLSTLTQADIRTAVGLASANLDTQLDALPTANENADALLDRTDGVEAGLTPRGHMRLTGAVLAGEVSGAGTGTEVFRNAVADSKARITATVDTSGNRTAITSDVT